MFTIMKQACAGGVMLLYFYVGERTPQLRAAVRERNEGIPDLSSVDPTDLSFVLRMASINRRTSTDATDAKSQCLALSAFVIAMLRCTRCCSCIDTAVFGYMLYVSTGEPVFHISTTATLPFLQHSVLALL